MDSLPTRTAKSILAFDELEGVKIHGVGILVGHPSILDLCRSEGRTFVIPPREPTLGWLTVTQAARKHLNDVDGITITRAKNKIYYACRHRLIQSHGFGHDRRIDPVSFGNWRLTQREKNLKRCDNGPGLNT